MNKFDNSEQATEAINMAIGRIFRLGSRSTQPGDIRQYEDAKSLIYDAYDYLGMNYPIDNSHSYARDYHKIHHD